MTVSLTFLLDNQLDLFAWHFCVTSNLIILLVFQFFCDSQFDSKVHMMFPVMSELLRHFVL